MNYSELAESIIGFLEEIDEDSFIARLDDFIIQTEQQIYRATNLPVLRTQSFETITLTVGSMEAPLPNDYLEILSVALTQTGGADIVRPLMRVDTSFIREAYADRASQGEPYHYAILNQVRILVGPAPDADYPIIYDYTRFPESIVTAGNTWLGDNAEQCLLFGCLVNAYTFLKGEADLVQQYRGMFDRELQLLQPEGDDSPTDQRVATQ